VGVVRAFAWSVRSRDPRVRVVRAFAWPARMRGPRVGQEQELRGRASVGGATVRSRAQRARPRGLALPGPRSHGPTVAGPRAGPPARVLGRPVRVHTRVRGRRVRGLAHWADRVRRPACGGAEAATSRPGPRAAIVEGSRPSVGLDFPRSVPTRWGSAFRGQRAGAAVEVGPTPAPWRGGAPDSPQGLAAPGPGARVLARRVRARGRRVRGPRTAPRAAHGAAGRRAGPASILDLSHSTSGKSLR
jgi:hypothetical protein